MAQPAANADSKHAILTPEGHIGVHKVLPVNDTLFEIRPEDSIFFKEQTGIHDDEELKTHIINVQRKAYEVAPYNCIYLYGFLKFVF